MIRVRRKIYLAVFLLSGLCASAATGNLLSVLPADCDGFVDCKSPEIRQAYAASIQGGTELTRLFDVIPFFLGETWASAGRLLEKYADGQCVIGFQTDPSTYVTHAIVAAESKTASGEIRQHLAVSGAQVKIVTDSKTILSTNPLHVSYHRGILFLTDDANLLDKATATPKSPTTSPWLEESVAELRTRTGGDLLFAYSKPGPFLNSLAFDTKALGLSACRGFGVGLGRSQGRNHLRLVLDGPFDTGLLSAVVSAARPLECYRWLSSETDGLLALTIDGKKGMDSLRALFTDNPKVLNDALDALKEFMGISMDAILASILSEQAAAFNGLRDFGPQNMAVGNLELLKETGVLAIKTHDTTLVQSLSGLVRNYLKFNVSDQTVDGIPMTVANLLELDKQPLFQAFLGREEGWSVGAMSQERYLRTMKRIKQGGGWQASSTVKEVFGGAPPASSGMAYLNLPPELAWPLLRSLQGYTNEPMPVAFKSSWTPVALNVAREKDGIAVEVFSPRVIDTARSLMVAFTP